MSSLSLGTSSDLPLLSPKSDTSTCWFDIVPTEITQHILSFAVKPSSASSAEILLVSKLFQQWGQAFLYETINITSADSALALNSLSGLVKVPGHENVKENFRRVKTLNLGATWSEFDEGELPNIRLVSPVDGYDLFPNLIHLDIRLKYSEYNPLWQQILGTKAPRQITMDAWSPYLDDWVPYLDNETPDGTPLALFSLVEDLTLKFVELGTMIDTRYPNLRRLKAQLVHPQFMATAAEELDDLSLFWDPIASILEEGCDKLESVTWEILVDCDISACPFTAQDVSKHLQARTLPNGVKPQCVIKDVWDPTAQRSESESTGSISSTSSIINLASLPPIIDDDDHSPGLSHVDYPLLTPDNQYLQQELPAVLKPEDEQQGLADALDLAVLGLSMDSAISEDPVDDSLY